MKILDLFCGGGGAGVGYHRAGFEVVGVDIDPQPDYPFEFARADALAVLEALAAGEYVLLGKRVYAPSSFDAIHASPPCQNASALTAGNRKRPGWRDEHIDLIEPTRALLEEIGKPYVIENVQGAHVRRDMTLCGEMFGLDVIRHRYFELGGWHGQAPAHVKHRGRVSGWRHGEFYPGPYVAVYGEGGGKGSVAQWQAAMGIDWTDDRHTIAEAIPPAYSEWVGGQLADALVLA